MNRQSVHYEGSLWADDNIDVDDIDVLQNETLNIIIKSIVYEILTKVKVTINDIVYTVNDIKFSIYGLSI